MDKKDINHNKNYCLPLDMNSADELKIEMINSAYSSDPWWYDIRGFLILTFSYRSTLHKQIRLFANNISDHHLEAAIGSGTLFEMILLYRKYKNLPMVKILGFDYAERMLTGARKRFIKEKQITLIRADASCLPLESNTFESTNIANSIHCLPEIEKGIQEFYRVLKPGGQVAGNCLLEPKSCGFFDRISRRINNWGIKKGILHRTYSKSKIAELLVNAGFEIKFEEIHGNCFYFIAQKPIERSTLGSRRV